MVYTFNGILHTHQKNCKPEQKDKSIKNDNYSDAVEACLSLQSFPSLERKGPLIKSPPRSGRGASQIASFTYCNNNSCLWALLFAKSFQTVPWILRETSWRFNVCAHSAGEKLRQEQWIHEARVPCPNWLGPKVWDTPPWDSCLSSEPAPVPPPSLSSFPGTDPSPPPAIFPVTKAVSVVFLVSQF